MSILLGSSVVRDVMAENRPVPSGVYILMVTKENKPGTLPKIHWAQSPGNKCVEFIPVHSRWTLAGCGSHVPCGSLGPAAQNHSRKLLFFIQVSVTKCLVHVPNGP